MAWTLSVINAICASAALIGGGHLILHLILTNDQRNSLRLSETLTLQAAAGMAAWSTLFTIAGVLGLVYQPVIQASMLIGAAAGLYSLIRLARDSATSWGSMGRDNMVALCTGLVIASAVAVFALRAMSSPGLHGDAQQYHMALPRYYMQAHQFVPLPSILQNGRWLGGDILYFFTLWPGHPEVVVGSKLFGLFQGSLLFLATYALARRLGAGRAAAMVSGAMLLSVDNLRWLGLAKNDALLAYLMVSVTLTVALFRGSGTRWPLLGGLLAGFSVSVKANALLLLLPLFALVIIRRQLTLKLSLVVLAAASLPILPWSAATYATTGRPIQSMPGFSPERPEYMREAWEQRNNNGMEFSITNFATYAVPMLLNRGHKVSGNASNGLVFLAALAVGLAMMFFPGTRKEAWVYLSAFATLLIFGVRQFDARFLTRYILFVPALVFAYCAVGVQHVLDRLPRLAWVLPLLAVLAFASGPTMKTWKAASKSPIYDTLSGRTFCDALAGSEYLGLVASINSNTHLANRVMINDARFYFLNVPFINVHMLHSPYIRFDQISYEEFKARMVSEGISTALLRFKISGIHEYVIRYVNEEMYEVANAGRVTAYAARGNSWKTADRDEISILCPTSEN